jgi:hypothetical protein
MGNHKKTTQNLFNGYMQDSSDVTDVNFQIILCIESE